MGNDWLSLPCALTLVCSQKKSLKFITKCLKTPSKSEGAHSAPQIQGNCHMDLFRSEIRFLSHWNLHLYLSSESPQIWGNRISHRPNFIFVHCVPNAEHSQWSVVHNNYNPKQLKHTGKNDQHLQDCLHDRCRWVKFLWWKRYEFVLIDTVRKGCHSGKQAESMSLVMERLRKGNPITFWLIQLFYFCTRSQRVAALVLGCNSQIIILGDSKVVYWKYCTQKVHI